jgi:hypothetical protein
VTKLSITKSTSIPSLSRLTPFFTPPTINNPTNLHNPTILPNPTIPTISPVTVTHPDEDDPNTTSTDRNRDTPKYYHTPNDPSVPTATTTSASDVIELTNTQHHRQTENPIHQHSYTHRINSADTTSLQPHIASTSTPFHDTSHLTPMQGGPRYSASQQHHHSNHNIPANRMNSPSPTDHSINWNSPTIKQFSTQPAIIDISNIDPSDEPYHVPASHTPIPPNTHTQRTQVHFNIPPPNSTDPFFTPTPSNHTNTSNTHPHNYRVNHSHQFEIQHDPTHHTINDSIPISQPHHPRSIEAQRLTHVEARNNHLVPSPNNPYTRPPSIEHHPFSNNSHDNGSNNNFTSHPPVYSSNSNMPYPSTHSHSAQSHQFSNNTSHSIPNHTSRRNGTNLHTNRPSNINTSQPSNVNPYFNTTHNTNDSSYNHTSTTSNLGHSRPFNTHTHQSNKTTHPLNQRQETINDYQRFQSIQHTLSDQDQLSHIINMSRNMLELQYQNLTNPSIIQNTMDRPSDDIPHDRSNNTKRRRYEDLPPNVRTVLCRMGATNLDDPEPYRPTQACIDIITAGNKSQATGYVNSLLKARKVLGRWSTGHINRFIVMGPLWMEPEEPFGLTMLGINCTGKPDIDSQKQLQIAMRDNMDDKMKNDDVDMLTKRDYFFPQTTHEIKVIFSTYEAILSALCNPDGILTRVMQSWIDHFDTNFSAYNALQSQSTVFGAKLVYQIDLSIQMYLEQLSNHLVPLSSMSTYNIEEEMLLYQHKITRRSSFQTTRLPSGVFQTNDTNNKKRKADGNNNNNNNNNNIDNHRQNNNNNNNNNSRNPRQKVNHTGSPSYNRNQKEAWKVPYPKQFHQCFYADAKKSNKVPKHDDKEFCIRFLALGECAHGSSCRYLHTDPRECGLEAQFDTFFATAYS